MGTSGSSDGPGPGIPFDPPWLDDIETPQLGNGQLQDDQGLDDNKPGGRKPQFSAELPAKSPEVAPPRRFANARRALREFARTGSKEAFRRAVGHYSHTGMGGARSVAIRMRTSSRAGANTFSFLQAARDKTDPDINEWVDSLTARNASAQEIANEIIRHTMPSGGSLDEAALQQSMALAMQDLLDRVPDIDLLNLDDNSIWALIESFLGYEAFNRLFLDIGQVFGDSALSTRDCVTRMNEMCDYLKAELSSQVEMLRRGISNATSGQLQSVLHGAIENTFSVYEGSI
jgi:hypothetical protein